MCPSSRAAFTWRRIAINHSTRPALHRASYSTILEPLLIEPNPSQSKPGLCADLLVCGIDGHSDIYVDVAITCPSAPTYIESFQVRRGKAVHTNSSRNTGSMQRRFEGQPGPQGLLPSFIQLVWETFGFFYPCGVGILDR